MQKGSIVSVKIKGNMDNFIKQVANYPVTDLDIKAQTLEEIFMHFYGGTTDDQ